MKKNISLSILLFATLFLLTIFSACRGTRTVLGDTNVNATAVKNMVDSQHFVFIAETANPLRGRYRNLTSLYDVRVGKDTVVSYLPYFGRSTTAPLDPNEIGIKFTSTDFSYSVNNNKSDRWEVYIKPKDVVSIQQLNFTIFSNGTATLSVVSTSRDLISYNGRVRAM